MFTEQKLRLASSDSRACCPTWFTNVLDCQRENLELQNAAERRLHFGDRRVDDFTFDRLSLEGLTENALKELAVIELSSMGVRLHGPMDVVPPNITDFGAS